MKRALVEDALQTLIENIFVTIGYSTPFHYIASRSGLALSSVLSLCEHDYSSETEEMKRRYHKSTVKSKIKKSREYEMHVVKEMSKWDENIFHEFFMPFEVNSSFVYLFFFFNAFH